MKLKSLLSEMAYNIHEYHLLDESKEFSEKRDYDLMFHVLKDRVFPVLAAAGVSPTPDAVASVTDFPASKVKAWLDANAKRAQLHSATDTKSEHNLSVNFNNFRGNRDMHSRDAAKLATFIVSHAKKSAGRSSSGRISLPKKQDIVSHLGWTADYLEDVVNTSGNMINSAVEKLLGRPVDVIAHALADNGSTIQKNKLAAWKAEPTEAKKQHIRNIIKSLLDKDPTHSGHITAEQIARKIYTPVKSYDTEFESLTRSVNKLLDTRKDKTGQYVNRDMFDLHPHLKTERQTRVG